MDANIADTVGSKSKTDWTSLLSDPDALWKKYVKYFEEKQWQDGDDLLVIGTSVRPAMERSPVGVQAIQILADAAGYNPELRPKYEEFRVLEQCVHAAFYEEKEESLTKQYLRVIGNSLDEETGRCREAVLNHLSEVSKLFSNSNLASAAIGIAVNLCAEQGKERDHAVEIGFDALVAKALSTDSFAETPDAVDRALLFLESLDIPRDLRKDEPLTTLSNVLLAAKSAKRFPTYARFAAIVFKYLEQNTLVIDAIAKRSDLFKACLEFLIDSEERAQIFLDLSEPTRSEIIQETLEAVWDTDVEAEYKDREIDIKVVRELLQTEDIARELITVSHEGRYQTKPGQPLPEAELSSLSKVLKSGTSRHGGIHIVAACMMLANMAAYTPSAELAVQKLQIHQTILDLLGPKTDRNVLRACAQCLHRLIESEPNREILGKCDAFESSVCLLYLRDPRISPEAALIIKRLLTETPSNVKQVLAPLSHRTYAHIREWQWQKDLDLPLPTSLFNCITDIYASNTDVADLAIAVIEAVKIDWFAGPKHMTEDFLNQTMGTPELATSTLHPIFTLLQNEPQSYPCRRAVFALGLLAHTEKSANDMLRYLETHEDALKNMERLIQAACAVPPGETEAEKKTRYALKETLSIILFGLTKFMNKDPTKEHVTELTERIWEMMHEITRGLTERSEVTPENII